MKIATTGHTYFDLKRTFIIEGANVPWIARRSDFRRAFSGKTFCIPCYVDYGDRSQIPRDHQPSYFSFASFDDHVRVGCKIFFGDNFKKLRRWALSKPRKKAR